MEELRRSFIKRWMFGNKGWLLGLDNGIHLLAKLCLMIPTSSLT